MSIRLGISPSYSEHDPWLLSFLNWTKKSNKKYFIKKESIGKSKLSNILLQHTFETHKNYPSIQTKCKFHLQHSRTKTKKCRKMTSDLDLVLVHMCENSVCFNCCVSFVLNMSKRQQRNLDSFFTVSQASSLSNSRYEDS